MALSTVDVQAKDPATSAPAQVAGIGAQIFAQDQVVLADTFEGSTLDSTDRWTETTASSGSVTQANGVVLLATSTNTAGSARISSNRVVPLISGSELRLRASVKIGTVGIASNTRVILLRIDANNYAGFVLSGTTLSAKVKANSVDLLDETINVVQIDSLNWVDLEMRLAKTYACFLVNGGSGWVQAASFSQAGQASTMMYGGGLMEAYIDNTNSGSSVDNTLYVSDFYVTRRSMAPRQTVFSKLMSASGIVTRGPCYFVSAQVTATSTVWDVYDDIDASGGDQIASITSAWLGGYHSVPIARECCNGIYADLTSGSGELLVFWTH